MVERLPYLALLILSIALIAYGFYHRRRRGKPCDRTFASKLAWASVGVATAIVGSIFPALWVFVSFTVNGGRIKDNMPPGYSAQLILAALLVGGAFTIISTGYSYGEHLDS